MTAGLLLTASGIAAVALLPGPVTIFAAAAAIGAGIGTATPLGFAHLAATTPPERLGRTMGSAELGRELGDAGGPLLVGAVATASTLPLGLGVLAAAVAATSLLGVGSIGRSASPTEPIGPER
jgi:MFS family permease